MGLDRLTAQLLPLVERETGMVFPASSLPRLEAAVRKLWDQKPPRQRFAIEAQATAQASFVKEIAVALTIGESFFFRNERHFEALREHVLPVLWRERRTSGRCRQLRIWSAGCATGEEPYSLAVLTAQSLAEAKSGEIRILATDINPDFLARAASGLYRPWSFRRTEIHHDTRYFRQEGQAYRVAPSLQANVEFRLLNLVQDIYPSADTDTHQMDLILFRNVAIYLQPDVVRRILANFYEALRPGGWLLLGEAELNSIQPEAFVVKRFPGATFFQKPSQGSGASGLTGGSGEPFIVCDKTVARSTSAGDQRIRTGSTGTGRGSEEPIIAPRLQGLTQNRSHGPELRNSTDQERVLAIPGKTVVENVAEPPSQAFPDAVEEALRRGDKSDILHALSCVPDREQRLELTILLVRQAWNAIGLIAVGQLLDNYLASRPTSLEAYLLKGHMYEEQGSLDMAEAMYRRVLYLDSRAALGHLHLGLLLLATDREQDGRRCLKRIIELAVEQQPLSLVEGGDGLCYGRLKQMAEELLLM